MKFSRKSSYRADLKALGSNSKIQQIPSPPALTLFEKCQLLSQEPGGLHAPLTSSAPQALGSITHNIPLVVPVSLLTRKLQLTENPTSQTGFENREFTGTWNEKVCIEERSFSQWPSDVIRTWFLLSFSISQLLFLLLVRLPFSPRPMLPVYRSHL